MDIIWQIMMHYIAGCILSLVIIEWFNSEGLPLDPLMALTSHFFVAVFIAAVIVTYFIDGD